MAAAAVVVGAVAAATANVAVGLLRLLLHPWVAGRCCGCCGWAAMAAAKAAVATAATARRIFFPTNGGTKPKPSVQPRSSSSGVTLKGYSGAVRAADLFP